MPLLKFHMRRGRAREEVVVILDAAHEAMVRSFGVPERDRYQIATEHDASHFHALDTGLGITRSDAFVLLEVVSRPRPRTAKVAFYADLCSTLRTRCGIAGSDVMVSFTENADEDWSFGEGRAQFLTGEL